MTNYDFRQHIGEWVETRRGDRVKVIAYNSEAPEHSQLIIQYQGGEAASRGVHGRNTSILNVLDLVPPVREYTTRAKLFRWADDQTIYAIEEDRWSSLEEVEGGRWISEPTEVTFKLLPGVKLP